MKVPEITKWKINYHIACGFILLMVILIYQDFIEMHSLENSAQYEIERQMRRERIPTLNSTIRNYPKAEFVFYNRLPKAGSSTLINVIQNMAKKHRFKVQFFNKPHQKHFISKDDEDDLKIELSQSVKPMIYIRHLHWIHFQEQQKPIYINMVRDPVELFISNFYYLRNGFQKTADKNNSEWKWNMSEDKRSQTIEDCIHAKDPECSSPYLQLIPYFCGNIEKCRSKKNWDWALERAKKNVQGNFAVIGLLEEEEKSIRLLKWTLPTFFDGAREYYNRKKNDLKSRSKTNDKPEVEKWAKEYLRSKLQDEYELYNLIKRIFYYKIGKLGFDDFK